ncbi:FAD-dependent pyridine nucleotide-disulfide oxidoreductase [Aminomonas paucivorans DSM 12260]|uniref:FAD-dependent pyridine nucleotide-disulfide oxidoreductase n=2 Tax=Aminomonas TaxID=81411 RepID=E3CX99_9BACT|nr:FAD-dependent oxidoreductase [Aminomonas paucivorans]EFQ22615.1 FAD-dependent pyridine nucleotide-disulfide oxidoreductase [Aminomonas paucivorans DSM 12260]
MGKNVLVVGGVACGAKVAARLRRLDPERTIRILEKGDTLSYAACGLPFLVGGTVPELKDLITTPVGVVRDAHFFRAVKDVEVLTGHLATRIDRAARVVTAVETATGEEKSFPYDQLVLATGASPVLPPLPGADLPGVTPLWNPSDALSMKQALDAGSVREAVVVGAGLVGLEAAEALVERGVKVTVVELLGHPLAALLDRDFGALMAQALRAAGVDFRSGTRVTGFEGEKGVLSGVRVEGEVIPAQLALVAVGVRPNVQLARDAGLEIGALGGILVDRQGRTSDPDIFAGGDCVQTFHALTGATVRQPMGSTANRQGRVIADNLAGLDTPFGGVLGTAVLRFGKTTAGRTGLSEEAAREAGFDPVGVTVTNADIPHFMPGSAPLVLRLLADRSTRRLLGAQVFGPGRGDKRLDVLATACACGATVDVLADVDLAYAPPFSSALDVVTHGANALRNKLDGRMDSCSPSELRERLEEGAVLLDVRSPSERKEQGTLPYDGVVSIPLGQLASRAEELPRDREIVAFCKISVRGWDAVGILKGKGFRRISVLEGGVVGWPYGLVRE